MATNEKDSVEMLAVKPSELREAKKQQIQCQESNPLITPNVNGGKITSYFTNTNQASCQLDTLYEDCSVIEIK